MIFNKKLKEKNKKLSDKLCDINMENEDLKNQIDTFKNRLKRVEYLLKNRVNKNARCLLERTKKKVNILVAMTINEYEIEIFDIDDSHTCSSRRSMVFWGVKNEDDLFIKDIQGGKSKGHGEIGMKHLIDMAEKLSIKRITGQLYSVDDENKRRQFNFFKKFEFDITENVNGEFDISKDLY